MAISNSVGGFSEYPTNSGGNTGPNGPHESDTAKYWSLDRLKRSYMDYLSSKTMEVEEQKDARRYRHASQWTAEQVKVFNKRKQPIVTYNRIGRKIDGVIGLIEKLKQSPKAFPRTPKEEQGAALATAVVRSVLDGSEWKTKSYLVGQNAAIDGFAGVELILEPGDQQDPNVVFEVVENDGFFYDPRSNRLDFSDARFMGMGKWLDLDQAKEMFPDKASEMEDAMESATDLSTNSDREQKWFITDGNIKRIRLIDEWYVLNGEWHWCIYTGNMKLQEGKSWLTDDTGKTFPKYIMFSAQVDQDGDRYGFVRNLKSAQDEINQRRSKALHLLNTRRIIAEQGAFDDVEVTRREAARPDGVVIRNKGFEAEFDDGSKNQEIQAHLEFLVDAKAEIENFGPNPALVGQGSLGDKSGRAISLLQQAGIAELGPFLLAFRGWKVRLYRAVWLAAKAHWTAERFVRVTDDENVLQFLGINQVSVDPNTGMPAMVNQLGKLDVDILMDEGPDSLTMGIETYEALLAIAQSGSQVPPDIIIELHPNLDPDTKKRLLEKLNQPNPQMQAELQKMQAEVQKVMADAELSKAKAIDTMRGDQGGPQEHPMVTISNIENTQADTAHKKAQAMATLQQAMLEPEKVGMEKDKMVMEQHNKAADRNEQSRQANMQARQKDRDSMQGAYDKAADRQIKQTDQQMGAYESERDARQSAYESDRDAQQTARDSDREYEQRAVDSDRNYEVSKAKAEGDAGAKPKKKKKSGVNISIDGTMASQMNDHAKANTEQIAQLSHNLGVSFAQATAMIAKASAAMAESSKSMAKSVDKMSDAISKPKRIVRDKSGRASHVETVG
jgi:hypothetical protein